MLLLSTLLCSTVSFTFAKAFNVSANAKDGIYTHSLDANGLAVTTFVADAPATGARPHNLLDNVSAAFHKRNTAPGWSTCSESVLPEPDQKGAVTTLAADCGWGQQFWGAKSVKFGQVVAYVCAYNEQERGTNTCDRDSVIAYTGVVAADCGRLNQRTVDAGYYQIPDWGISYGYDAVEKCFCNCDPKTGEICGDGKWTC